jgi:methyltransferase
MVESRWLFSGLVALVATMRGIELLIAKRNQRWLEARGGVEVGQAHYPWMVLLHASFLLAAPAEVWFLNRPMFPPLAAVCLLLTSAAMALRYWVIATLGRRWTTRVVCLPGALPVTDGPFRFLRHPNYLAVAVEILALPLIHSAWLTAGMFSVLNGYMLKTRIRVEEAAWRRLCQPD